MQLFLIKTLMMSLDQILNQPLNIIIIPSKNMRMRMKMVQVATRMNGKAIGPSQRTRTVTKYHSIHKRKDRESETIILRQDIILRQKQNVIALVQRISVTLINHTYPIGPNFKLLSSE